MSKGDILAPLVNRHGHFKVTKLWYAPFPEEQEELFIRPYEVRVRGDAIRDLEDDIIRTDATEVGTKILSKYTAQIITPSTRGYLTSINRSFLSQGRMGFMMRVEEISDGGSVIVNYLMGYTEHDDVIVGRGSKDIIDPAMEHYVTSIVETGIQKYTTRDHTGREIRVGREVIIAVYDVMRHDSDEHMYLQRPGEIISNIKKGKHLDRLGAMNRSYLDEDDLDDDDYDDDLDGGRPSRKGDYDLSDYTVARKLNDYTDQVETSYSENNTATTYLNRILSSGIGSSQSLILTGDMRTGVRANDVTPPYIESTISDSRFMGLVSDIEGFDEIQDSFTIESIEKLDPDLYWKDPNDDYDKVKVFYPTGDIDPRFKHVEDRGNRWDGRDHETIMATSFIIALMSIAQTYTFHYLVMEVDNTESPDLNDISVILDFDTLMGRDTVGIKALLNNVKRRFLEEVYLPYTQGGLLPCFLEFHINTFGASKVYIEWEEGDGEWFMLPTLVKNYVAPVMTPDYDVVLETSNRLDRVIQNVTRIQNEYRDINGR